MPIDFHMRILIVDDVLSMRKIVRLSLKQLGFNNLDEAENGQHTLSKLRTGTYGLVVSDWNMPVIPGIDLLRAIRADEQLKKLPVLMITAEAQKANLIEAMQAGVSHYIVKPFTRLKPSERSSLISSPRLTPSQTAVKRNGVSTRSVCGDTGPSWTTFTTPMKQTAVKRGHEVPFSSGSSLDGSVVRPARCLILLVQK